MADFFTSLGLPPIIGLFISLGTYFLVALFPVYMAFMIGRFWRTGAHGAEPGPGPSIVHVPAAIGGAATCWWATLNAGVLAPALGAVRSAPFPGSFKGVSAVSPSYEDLFLVPKSLFSDAESAMTDLIQKTGFLGGGDMDVILVRIALGLSALLMLSSLGLSLVRHFVVVTLAGLFALTITVPAALAIGDGAGLAVVAGLASITLLVGVLRKD